MRHQFLINTVLFSRELKIPCGEHLNSLLVIYPLLILSRMFLKAMIKPNREGMVCLKSKASVPGMARPIRMDAGILCDQAYLS
ncbi:hypothetical protein T296_06050 [Pantoea agglomerans Eh318]|nr:hypothetical protein T296_06050 [Pantoea agglomerans Eh318]